MTLSEACIEYHSLYDMTGLHMRRRHVRTNLDTVVLKETSAGNLTRGAACFVRIYMMVGSLILLWCAGTLHMWR